MMVMTLFTRWIVMENDRYWRQRDRKTKNEIPHNWFIILVTMSILLRFVKKLRDILMKRKQFHSTFHFPHTLPCHKPSRLLLSPTRVAFLSDTIFSHSASNLLLYNICHNDNDDNNWLKRVDPNRMNMKAQQKLHECFSNGLTNICHFMIVEHSRTLVDFH